MARIEIFSSAHGDCSLEPNWWLFALRGLLALAFGGLTLMMPLVAVLALTMIFGAYAILDGVLHLVSGLSLARKGKRWGGLVAGGLLGIAAGLGAFLAPQLVSMGLTAFLWTLVAVWIMATGVMAIATAIRLRQESRGGWTLAWSGGLSVLLGVAMAVVFWRNPVVSMAALGLFIAINAAISGALLLLLAFKLLNFEPPQNTGGH